jgi:FkbM family methyltransferase
MISVTNKVKRTVAKIIAEVKFHYPLFGLYGLLLAIKARLSGKEAQVSFLVPGLSHSVHLRLGTSDVPLFWEIFLYSQYAWEHPRNPKVIVDAGANIGLSSIFYAQVYPQARIIAIEPEPSNFEILRKNTTAYSNITVVHAALWSGNREVTVFDVGAGRWGFQTGEAGELETSRSHGLVRGVTLDTLMKENGIDWIDLLKVDIEGAEKEVFASSIAWIDRVGAIAVELHDRFKVGCNDSVSTATKHFELRCQRGETSFIVREEPDGKGSLQMGVTLTKSSWFGVGPGFPLKITRAA